MNINNIRVRMYRQGFGDCFLLQFFAGRTRKFTMLIDCGLKHKDKVVGVEMRKVVADIKAELNKGKSKNAKPKLDVLVATHEHWDHVSGFHPKEKMFDDFKIGKIWMGWTESPEDKEAILIRKHLKKAVKAAKIANEKLKKARSSNPGFYSAHVKGREMGIARQKFGESMEKLVEFFGPLGVKELPSGISLKEKYQLSINTEEAMEHLKSLANGESGIEYYYPGDLIENKSKLPGIRIYVLGPPKGSLLNKDTPSSGAKKEVYFGLDNYAMMGFMNGLLAKGDAEGNEYDDGSPFNDVEAIAEDAAKKHPYYKEFYYRKENAWRDVEEDWLNLSGALAMQLDNDTNNTSLALAIEFVESGKVLLFPGDAQVGNWLSWHQLEWSIKGENEPRKVKAEDLLNNTVLYKAGHHLSHNATLKKEGLEMMKSDELVVLIPEKHDQYSGIPYGPLIDMVRQKSKGRFVFSADKNYPPDKILKRKPAALSEEEWEEFKGRLEVDKVWVEVKVEG